MLPSFRQESSSSVSLWQAQAGAWISSMIGVSVDSPRLKPFEEAIQSGQLLMMVGVSADRVDEITTRIYRHHSDAKPEGIEPNIPAFP